MSRRRLLRSSCGRVPRAEIAVIIMQQGEKPGTWTVPPRLFAAMLCVSAVTSVAAPLALRRMLSRWPPGRAPDGENTYPSVQFRRPSLAAPAPSTILTEARTLESWMPAGRVFQEDDFYTAGGA